MGDLDDRLRKYLDDVDDAKRRGATPVDIMRELRAHKRDDEKRFDTLDARLAGLDRKLLHEQAKVDHLEDQAETTGSHAVEALTTAAEARALAHHPAGDGWTTKALRSTTLKVIGLLASAGVGWLVHHLTWH